MKREIIAYYDRLAPSYDETRFAGSYGRFIDERERDVLRAWLPAKAITLDLGCGTGRLSSFATVAADASTASLAVAQTQWRAARLVAADAERLPFPDGAFDAAIAFHLLMHLDRSAIRATLRECARVLRPGGILIADIVSKTRRNITGARHDSSAPWHAATAMTTAEFEREGATAGFRRQKMTGLLALPIHRIPPWARAPLARIDAWLSQTAPSLSSYLIAKFEKV
jgi:ubiquinone/menaquinone biosynthesis C-methylase UbiE